MGPKTDDAAQPSVAGNAFPNPTGESNQASEILSPPFQSFILYLKLTLTAVFWGGTFVAGRLVAAEAGPFSAAFLRFLSASIFLCIFLFKSHGRIPSLTRHQLLPILMLALTGIFAYNVFFFSGLKTITATRASLIVASNPAFIVLFSSIFLKERLTPFKILGVIVSITGASIVISKGNPMSMLRGELGQGELFIFGCVLSWVSYSLIGKVAMKTLSPLVTVTYACCFGTILLLIPALLEGVTANSSGYSLRAWCGVLYLGFFGSALGFCWYYEGVKIIGPSRSGVFINIVPVSSIILARLILAEKLDPSLGAGAALIFFGVYLTNKGPTKRPESPYPE